MIDRLMKVAIYARCSTKHDQKPEVQLRELKRYVQARGWTIEHELIDHGYSGTTDRRPGLKKLLSLAKTRQIDCVVVIKIDRLFRSLKNLIITLEEWNQTGIKFISLKDNIDMTTSSGILLMQIIGAMAQFEASLIRERTILGLEFARSKGKRLGRPPRNLDKEILDLRSQGLSYRAIQKRLKCGSSIVGQAIKRGALKRGQNNE